MLSPEKWRKPAGLGVQEQPKDTATGLWSLRGADPTIKDQWGLLLSLGGALTLSRGTVQVASRDATGRVLGLTRAGVP